MKHLTIEQVAKELNVSKRTILREIKRGKLVVEKVGRRYLVSEPALKYYLEGEKDISKEIREYLKNKRSEMIELLQHMVSLASETGDANHELHLAHFIKSKMESWGIRSVMYSDEGAVAVRGTVGYADTGIFLDCPLDTTPAGDPDKWSHPPFEGIIKQGKMYGRGTADCKAGIAAMMFAVRALKKFADERRYRVEMVFDGGEQNGSYNGMKLILKHGLPVTAGIIGYAGEGNEIGIGCRGWHRYKLTSKGHSVHSGARHRAGVNAITNMAALIMEMDNVKFPLPKNKLFSFGSKMTVAIIEGGRAINIIPDECISYLDVRTTPDLKKKYVDGVIEKLIKSAKLRHKGFDVKAQYLLGEEGYVTQDEELTKVLKETVQNLIHKTPGLVVYGPGNIGNLLARYDIPAIVWGPKGANMHSYDEHVEIDSVWVTSEVYAKCVLNFFGIT